jgi:hypothetical protein
MESLGAPTFYLFSYFFSFASLYFFRLHTPHIWAALGNTPFFLDKSRRTIYLSRRAKLRANETTKDGSVGSMDGWRGRDSTRNDPTAWTSPFFFSFFSPSGPFPLFVWEHIPLTSTLFFFFSFANFKDTLFVVFLLHV